MAGVSRSPSTACSPVESTIAKVGRRSPISSEIRSTVAATVKLSSRLRPERVEHGLVREAVLRPADRRLEAAHRLAGLQAENAVHRADVVAVRGQARLQLLAVGKIERRLVDRPGGD